MIRFICVLCAALFARGDIIHEPAVQLRWDFSSCNKKGRFGPTQDDCNDAYEGTSNEGIIELYKGVQTWTSPIEGLYLITACGPSGTSNANGLYGRGACVTSDFRMEKGEQINILVGQQSDYTKTEISIRGAGGSGGTFVLRKKDNFVMLVGGGGSSAAGETPSLSMRNHSDASLDLHGKPASSVSSSKGQGGIDGQGGLSGVTSSDESTSSGGGAGLNSDGDVAMFDGDDLGDLVGPMPARMYFARGFREYGVGVGGYMTTQEGDNVFENNGGFGGGGSGSHDSGAGGGGGYSGGGGGPTNGWGGGGGSINNGRLRKEAYLHRGTGSVTISLLGNPCCGPLTVYVILSFLAGVLITIIIAGLLYKCIKRRVDA